MLRKSSFKYLGPHDFLRGHACTVQAGPVGAAACAVRPGKAPVPGCAQRLPFLLAPELSAHLTG